MKKIERLAIKFRNAIDAARESAVMRRHPTFSRFPNDCCDLTCDLLGQYLLENNIETYQINGKCKNDEQWHHVWLITKDKIVIDITGDQFENGLVPSYDVQAVHVGAESSIHEIFSLDRQTEANTVFTDSNEFTEFGGTPNTRQRNLIQLYEVICRYL